MITVTDVLNAVPQGCNAIVLDPTELEREVTGPATLESATPANLAYIKHTGVKGITAAQVTPSAVMILPASLEIDPNSLAAVLIIQADNPRLTFARIVHTCFVSAEAPGIHPSSAISDEASIDASVSIGPGCSIGACSIGADCVIHSGVQISDGVSVASGVTIHSGASLGADGFGYERDENGIPVKIPHLGGIVIERDVEIGANAAIDRGTIGDTIIEHDAKIDNLVHVAHNVRVGAGSMIAASAVIAGSTVLGERVWIGPLACVSNGLEVGDDAEVSLGAVVTRDVPKGTRVTGYFAVEHDTFLRRLRALS